MISALAITSLWKANTMHCRTVTLAVWLIGVFAPVGLSLRLTAAENNPSQVAEQVYQGELGRVSGSVGLPRQGGHHSGERPGTGNDRRRSGCPGQSGARRSRRATRACGRSASGRSRPGYRTLIVAFDHFFRQYRPGQDAPRRLTPDMPEYVALIAKISQFAAAVRAGLGAVAAESAGNRPGVREGHGRVRPLDALPQGSARPADRRRSACSCGANDAGPTTRVPSTSRTPVCACSRFRNTRCGARRIASCHRSRSSRSRMWRRSMCGRAARRPRAQRIRVHGSGRTDVGPLNRVLVVQMYRTPEMDYFSTQALPYLKKLVDQYAEAGVKLNALYSDEMHIQQDWGYFQHHDHGEFAQRYVSDGLARVFAERYGEEYRDLAKYLVYFTRGQEDFAHDLSAKEGVMHVFGRVARRPSARRRCSGRATTTCCKTASWICSWRPSGTRSSGWDTGWNRAPMPPGPRARRSTAGIPAGNRTHRISTNTRRISAGRAPSTRRPPRATTISSGAISSPATATTTPRAAGSTATTSPLALACSTGILNEVPNSYAAHWGMPDEVHQRRTSLVSTYGASGHPYWTAVQDAQHRDVDVLMLYPLDLVAVDERFGSWMTQYGYANYITPRQAARARHGAQRGDRVGRAPVHHARGVVRAVSHGGTARHDAATGRAGRARRVVRSATRAAVRRQPGRRPWNSICSAWTTRRSSTKDCWHPAGSSRFRARCRACRPQTILTDFLVDRIYPVTPRADTQAAGHCASSTPSATCRRYPSGGTATFLGYRPRDDQSRSLGYESRNWFEVLAALGAYPPTGRFAERQRQHRIRVADHGLSGLSLSQRDGRPSRGISARWRRAGRAALHARTKTTARIWQSIRCRTMHCILRPESQRP